MWTHVSTAKIHLPLLGSLDSAMDRFWIYAANYALEHNMPVLGICRGLQLVNVAFGGSLYQDLSYMNPGPHAPLPEAESGLSHPSGHNRRRQPFSFYFRYRSQYIPTPCITSV